MSRTDRRDRSGAEAVRDALDALVTAWRYDVGERSSALEALSAPHLRPAVDREVAAMLDDARRRTLANRWRVDDVARVVRRTKWIDAPTESLILSALEQPHTVRVASAGDLAAVVRALVFLADLPVLPELSSPRDARGDDPEQERMLEKVRALLAKAESTTYEEEAEAFTAKAQELMARYAIDEAIVDAKRASTEAPEAGGVRIGVDEPYASPKAVLLARIALANRCRSVWSDGLGLATVFGSHGDLRAVEVLYTSLLVQAVAAMQRAGSQVDAAGRIRTRSFRHAFLLAFADRIGERLQEASRAAEAEAAGEIGGDFLPVLASRAEAAERARDAAFPRRSKMRTSLSNVAGYHAGRAAADAASIERGSPLRR